MTYEQAVESIPHAAEWTSSFGYPGEGGYVEYHRDESGARWVISNGPYHALRPFDWTCERR